MKLHEDVWVDIKDADGYQVSSAGEVRNASTGKLIKPQITPNGVVYIPLYVNGEKKARSLRPLVANAFVEGKTTMFNTAIHLDGDKLNHRADNLVWRPHWFAVKYSRQFLKSIAEESKGPVVDSERRVYETVRDAGIANGVLFRDVYLSCRVGTPVFPTKQVFSWK